MASKHIDSEELAALLERALALHAQPRNPYVDPDKYIVMDGPEGVRYHRLESMSNESPPRIVADKEPTERPPWDAHFIAVRDLGAVVG